MLSFERQRIGLIIHLNWARGGFFGWQSYLSVCFFFLKGGYGVSVICLFQVRFLYIIYSMYYVTILFFFKRIFLILLFFFFFFFVLFSR